MASEYYGVNRGTCDSLNLNNVAVGTSTQSTDIELRVDLTKSVTILDVYKALDLFRAYLEAGPAIHSNELGSL